MFRKIIAYAMLAYCASGCGANYQILNNPNQCSEKILTISRKDAMKECGEDNCQEESRVYQNRYDQKLSECAQSILEELLKDKLLED
jgi:hypothetical protein